MQVDIAGATVDLDQLKVAENHRVVDAVLVARVQNMDTGAESMGIACSTGLSYFTQFGLINAAVQHINFGAGEPSD